MRNISKLPKVELHCHLEGSLSMDFIRETSNLSIEAIRSSAQVSDDTCKNLTEYLEKFELPLECMQTTLQIKNAATRFIETLIDDNIIYIEVRFSPYMISRGRVCERDVLESVLDGLKTGYKKYGIRSQAIVCTMRGQDSEANMNIIKLAKEYLGYGVCGIDIAGDESLYPMYLYNDIFKFARNENIPFTIHAGECGRAENIREAVELGARRIGHGIAMRHNKSIQDLCAKKRIGIEMCPISNRQTKAVSGNETYPLKEFIQSNLCVTVNTDNRTVSNTTLEKEFSYLRDIQQISTEDQVTMVDNAIECSFLDDSLKQEIWRQVHSNQAK